MNFEKKKKQAQNFRNFWVLGQKIQQRISINHSQLKMKQNLAKARAELLADSAMSTYNHKFGTFIYGNHIDYRSSWFESLIEPKRLELDRTKKMEASLIAYEFLILQHATLKCILEKKYDELINITIYDKFIAPKLIRRHSQYAIVAPTRSGAV